MWLAQFVYAPQFFKTPSELCGHTIYLAVLNIVVVMGECYCFAVYFPFTVIFEGRQRGCDDIYTFFFADVLGFFF
jgi:hypothetical protein